MQLVQKSPNNELLLDILHLNVHFKIEQRTARVKESIAWFDCLHSLYLRVYTSWDRVTCLMNANWEALRPP